MDRLILYKQIESVFSSMKRYEKRSNKKYFFILAHFGTENVEKLSDQQLLELLVLLERKIKTTYCCGEHNQFRNKMRNARRRNVKSAWYIELRRRNVKSAWYIELRRRMREGLEKCVNCPATTNLTLDHILPIAKGGRNTRENVQVMCAECNEKKMDLIPAGLEAIPFK